MEIDIHKLVFSEIAILLALQIPTFDFVMWFLPPFQRQHVPLPDLRAPRTVGHRPVVQG